MNEILIIICVIVVIYLLTQNKPKDKVNDESENEDYINVTNPFIEGVSQKEFADQDKLVNDIPVGGYTNNPSSSSILYKKNRMAKDFYNNKKNRIFDDIEMLKMLKMKNQHKNQKPHRPFGHHA